jgi:hypothetical protein
MFSGRKLPLTLAFIVLVGLAFGASCKGFFTDATLQSVSIQPTAPQVQVDQQITLQAWGTDSNNHRSQIKSGVGWSSDTPTVGTVTGTGDATLQGVSPGTTIITVSAQGLSATATATVIGDVTSITVSPISGTVKIGATGTPFTFAATPGPPLFITADNGGTLIITPSDSFFTCIVGVDASNNPAEVCSATQGAASQYTLVMTYPDPSGGTVTSPTATVTVN